VLPLQFVDGQNRESLGLTGFETFAISGVPAAVDSCGRLRVRVTADNKSFEAIVRVDTPVEAEYYRNGGILHTSCELYVGQVDNLRRLGNRPARRGDRIRAGCQPAAGCQPPHISNALPDHSTLRRLASASDDPVERRDAFEALVAAYWEAGLQIRPHQVERHAR